MPSSLLQPLPIRRAGSAQFAFALHFSHCALSKPPWTSAVPFLCSRSCSTNHLLLIPDLYPLSSHLHFYFAFLLFAVMSTDLWQVFAYHHQLCASPFLLFSNFLSSTILHAKCLLHSPHTASTVSIPSHPSGQRYQCPSLQLNQKGIFTFHIFLGCESVFLPSRPPVLPNLPFPIRFSSFIHLFSILPVPCSSIKFCPSAMLCNTIFSVYFNYQHLPLQVSPRSSSSEKRGFSFSRPIHPLEQEAIISFHALIAIKIFRLGVRKKLPAFLIWHEYSKISAAISQGLSSHQETGSSACLAFESRVKRWRSLCTDTKASSRHGLAGNSFSTSTWLCTAEQVPAQMHWATTPTCQTPISARPPRANTSQVSG